MGNCDQSLTQYFMPKDFKHRYLFSGRTPPRCHRSFAAFTEGTSIPIHHNGKDCHATETGAREQTPVMWLKPTINHLPQVPINNQQLGGLQGQYRQQGSNPRSSQQQSSILSLVRPRRKVRFLQLISLNSYTHCPGRYLYLIKN